MLRCGVSWGGGGGRTGRGSEDVDKDYIGTC